MRRVFKGRGLARGDFRQDARRRLQRAPAGHEGARSPEAAAGVQDPGLGLCRRAGRRRAGRRRQGGDGAGIARARPRRGDLWREPLHAGGDLGRRIEFRPEHGPAPAGAVALDPRLLRRAGELFPLRAYGDLEDHRPRRRAGRQTERIVGGRVRADPVHALDLPAARGRLRGRRTARHRRFGARRARFDRPLPRASRAGAPGFPGASKSSCRPAIPARRGARPGNPCPSGRRRA